MSHLYVIATPIGNLGDVTYRAIELLGGVDRVLAEDTRRTRVLLDRYEIQARLTSLHTFNEAARTEQIIDWLDAGEELGLVSDAGTPLLSDPGARIVRRVVAAGHTVVPVPGPSAVVAALSASGLNPEPFTFYGYTPRSGGARGERLDELAALEHTAVIFEAPTRVLKLLEDLEESCGPDRRIAVCRELTKVHEDIVRGTLARAVGYYQGETPRGEFVLVLAGAEDAGESMEAAHDEAARLLAASLLEEGRRPSAIARELARRLHVSRNRAYEIALAVADEHGGEGI